MRVKHLIPFLILALVFGFALACNGYETSTEEEVAEVIEEPAAVEEVIEEEVIEEVTEEDIEAEYIANTLVITAVIIDIMEESSQAASDFVDGRIGIAEHKIIAKKYVKNINSCYDMYLELEPPKRLEKAHDLWSEAMKHYLNSATFMQRYIETDDMEKMNDYIVQATSELKLGNEYMNKSTEQINRLAE